MTPSIGTRLQRRYGDLSQLLALRARLEGETWEIVWRLLYIGVVAALIYGALSQWTYDDVFITYRYAENLLQGRGLVYNVGEPVQGFTSPLFAITLALFGFIWRDLPSLANAVGSLSLPLGALFLHDLALSWKRPLVGWTALLLYPTFPLLLSTLGSEMPLYLAFCIGTFAFYARGRYNAAAVFAALAVLTRPEGILVGLPLAAYHLWRFRQEIPWRAVGLFLVLVLPWFIFAWIYFGSPLPNTLYAKRQQGAMLISEGFGLGLLTTLRDLTPGGGYWLEAGLAALGTALVGWRAHRWALFLAWPLLYFVSYCLLGVSRYTWYYAPLVPGFLTAVGLGLTGLAKRCEGRASLPRSQAPGAVLYTSSPRARTLVPSPEAFTGLVLALLLLLALFQGRNLLQINPFSDARVPIYRAVGNWLETNTPRQSMIATLEVGVIGYYAQRRMVDFAGLLQPQVADHLTPNATYDDAAIWAAEHFHPDFIVLADGSLPHLEQGYVAQHCVLTMRFWGDQYRFSTNMSVYYCEWP